MPVGNSPCRRVCVPYLFWLVGVGQRYHHPDDVEVVERRAGGEGAGQDGRLAAGHLDAALGHGHVQRPHTHCGKKTEAVDWSLDDMVELYALT